MGEQEIYADYTESLKQWLIQEHDMTEETAVVFLAGIQVGVAIVKRHPKHGKGMHALLMDDIKIRAGGSITAFGLMAAGTGDERTAPEQMADYIADEVLLEP